MTWPLAADLAHRLISWGDPVEHAWVIAWDARAFTRDPLDIFNANVLFPYRNTLAYSDHLIGQALLVAPVYWITENPILAQNLTMLIAYTLCGFLMYLLVVDLTGSWLAGAVAGLAYAFAPSRLAHFEHTNLLSAQWMPLAVLAARRSLRGRSVVWAGVTGLALFLQGLFAIYYFFFTLLLLGVVLGTWLLWQRSRAGFLDAAQVAAACVVACVLLLPTLLPYQQVSDDLGIEREPEEIQFYRARLSDYLAVHPGNRLYGETLGARFHRNVERDLFPGLALAGLAGIGLLNRRFGWDRWMFLVLIAVCVVLSAGLSVVIAGHEAPLPYRLLYDLLPGFRAIRVPARFGGLLALVGLCALAGLGVDLLLRRVRMLLHRHATAATTGLAGAFALAICAEGAMAWTLPPPLPATLEEARRPDYAWMAAHPAPAIELPMGEGPVASSWPNFWSTMHWNQVVNGYGAVIPPAYYPLRERMRAFPSAETVRLLQGLGVQTVVYHSDPAIPPGQDPLLRAIHAFPELSQVVGPPDYVFHLQPDPWMWRLADALPDGAAVDLPALPEDPVTYGLLAAILQRQGHTVYGEGSLEYWRLLHAPAGTCYAILPARDDPAAWGYPAAREVAREGTLALLRAAECG